MYLAMYAHIQDSMSYVRAANCTIYFLSQQEVRKEQQEDSKGIYTQDSFLRTWIFIKIINEIAIIVTELIITMTKSFTDYKENVTN